MKSGIVLLALIATCAVLPGRSSGPLYAQDGAIVLSGSVRNESTKQPVEFASVGIVELRVKARTGPDGGFQLNIPKPGTYTVVVSAPGLTTRSQTLSLTESMVRDFELAPASLRGSAITITEQRDVQNISRYTLTAADIKEVPASFGDSVSALTSLPGVIRTSGFFGPLVIRGAASTSNRYYIDDIPVYNPQHFFALQSVISSDLIGEIDLYGSAFPAQFGNALGAVININTIDSVKELTGKIDVSIISANAIVSYPIKTGDDTAGKADTSKKEETAGYIIAAARYGYLSLLVPPIYELITGNTLISLPEYYDYQLKAKYYPSARHSFTLLFFGSRDYIKFINKGSNTQLTAGDPLLGDFRFYNDLVSNSLGLYYTYQPVAAFKNTLLSYMSLNDSYNYLNVENAASWVRGLNITSKPYIFGVKDRFAIQWWKNIAELRGAAETSINHFTTEGFSLIPQKPVLSIPDFSDESLFKTEPLNKTVVNVVVGGYLENKITVNGFTAVLGVRTDYLNRSGTAIVDPRGMASYEFRTGTTVSAAAGRYSTFYQTNPYIFNLNPNYASVGKELKPERAVHRSMGVSQKISLVTVQIEGFYNDFYDLAQENSRSPVGISSTGEQRAYGAEISVRLDRTEGENGFFGWTNYTYTRSRIKSGLPADYDPYGDTWLNFNEEQRHAFKLVAGYVLGKHTFSARFQVFSSSPYTPITGGKLSPDPTPPGENPRYVRTFDGAEPYSAHFEPDHRLDVRYSYKTPRSWGYISWYVEVINVYNNQPVRSEQWDYSKPYGQDNPLKVKGSGISLIPNFGIEVKF